MKLGTVSAGGAHRVAVAAGDSRAVLLAPGLTVAGLNLTELGGPVEVTISGTGTLSNPVEYR